MRSGVSVSSTHLVRDHSAGAQRIIERAHVARDAGLDSLSLGDHHSVGVPYYQGVPMVGRKRAGARAEVDRSMAGGSKERRDAEQQEVIGAGPKMVIQEGYQL